MARDRQRAKQRRARRAAQNPGPPPSEPHRANVPGELEHSSGEVDEFEAALVRGADGRPADAETQPADAFGAPPEQDATARALPAQDEDADGAVADEGLEREALTAAPGPAPAPAPGATAPTAAGQGFLTRFLAFLRASWSELQRVQWPDRRQVAQATAVVIGCVIVAGVYLGVADKVAQEVVALII